MGHRARRTANPLAAVTAALALALAACGGEPGNANSDSGVISCFPTLDDGMSPSDFGEAVFDADVCFVGEGGALWSNGEIVGTGLDTAVSVFVSGGDVYVAGRKAGQSVVWKNGSTEAIAGAISSIFVSGGDVYVAGGRYNQSDQTQAAVLWVNGKPTHLAESGFDPYGPSTTAALSVAVSDGVVYVAGKDGGDAVLWVDGEPRRLGRGAANSVCVSGGDVYVAGKLEGKPTLWKNGSARTLGYSQSGQYEYPYNSARQVAASGGNAYVAGHADYYAMLWTNGGAAARLSNGKTLECANAVAVAGGSVYAVGSAHMGLYQKSRLWLDGRPIAIPNVGPVVSVFVAERGAGTD
jgi:hypothetical protein